MFRIIPALIILLMLSVFTSSQAATRAGVHITNQAVASYLDTGTGIIVHVVSNIASLVVAPLLAVEQDQDQFQYATVGQPVYFPHTIINTGNQADSYLLTVENLLGDNGNLNNLKIYLDENGDGLVNPGEREITQTDLMQPGDRIQVVITGTIPDNANLGDQFAIKLTTQSTKDPSVIDSDSDTLSISEGAIIRLDQQGDVDCSIQLAVNDRSYHEVSFTNTGTQAPTERTVNVGGVDLQGVLIETPVSPYFQLLKDPALFVTPTQGIPLVADALGQWMEYTQWDGLVTISKLAVLLPASVLKAQQSGKFGYTLLVNNLPQEATVINLQSTIDLQNDGRPDFQSNTRCNTLAADPIIKDRDGQDLGGTVFDSANLEAVPGARIELMSLADNLPVAETFSDAQGHFEFVNIKAGEYYIRVTPPATHTAPSIRAPEQFTTYTVTQASYGLYGFVASGQTGSGNNGTFILDDSVTALVFDIPLDRNNSSGQIAIDKQASTQTIGIGELVAYTVKISNLADQDLYAAYIQDTLPLGFKYIKGTAKLDDQFISDPLESTTASGNGASTTALHFRVGDFLSGAEHTLTYVTQVTALASGSDGINTAYALGTTITALPVQSPTVRAQVVVKQTGVLSDRAILFGRIALEKGCQVGTPEQQQQGYPLAGVRLYMEDGTYVITDPQGQYSLYGLQPGVHVLKVDLHTLPDGLQFLLKDTAQAGDPDSRFVDLLPGDFNRADFTADCPQAETRTVQTCTEPVYKQVEQCVNKPVKSTKTEWTTRTVNNAVAPIYFDSGKAVITPDYVQKLNNLINMTRDKKNVRFKFVGHTDNERLKPDTKKQFGTNQGLSEARAQEVAEFVLKNLAVKTQISVDGKGETQPVASNDNPAGMAKNRRVELVMYYDEATSKQVDVQQSKQECTTRPILDSDKPSGCTSNTITEASPVIERLLANEKLGQKGWGNEVDNIDPANRNNLKNLAQTADNNGDISNGLVEAYRQQVKGHQEDFAREQEAVTAEKSQEPNIPDPKEVVKTITTEQAKTGTWLWPLGDTSLDGRFMVVVRADSEPTFTVNGQIVSSSQLGEQIVNNREKAQILAWYGVELQEGMNELKVTAKDSFGNERVLAEKSVKRPSAGVAIKMHVDGTLTADRGRSTVPINIEVLDINGYPAKGTYFLTLEASDGSWAEPDIQDKVPGHQVKVTNGARTVHLRSSAHSGEIKLVASTGNLQSEADLAQVAELRPLVAVGLLDLRAHKGYGQSYENLGLVQLDNSAQDIEVNGRAALFMKGRVRGDMHLTLAYDSEKDAEAELLRDIDPAEYYRVYGDSSLRGYEAQSRSQLYVKLEKDRNSLMWGDYITDNETTTGDIARVQRTLTGLNGIYDNGKTRLQAFAAQQDNLRGYEEIPGNGTAMQYQLRDTPIVRNSEIIEIVTRDRDNAGLIVSTEQLQRFRDYSLDDVSGYMTFHRVIPTVDDELNPVFIRISYDRVEQGDNYLVAGVRLLHRFSDELSVGASYTQDQHATEGYKIAGVNAAYKTADTSIEAGIARMAHKDGSDGGNAVRIQASKKWSDQARTEITAVQADAGYENNSAGVMADRRELKLTHEQKLMKGLDGKVELVHSESLSTTQQRQSAEVSVTTQIDAWKLKGGVRQIRESDETQDETVNTALIGVERGVEIMGRKGSIKAEYEREIGGSEGRQRASIGADIALTDKTKAYLRYEQSDRLASGTLSGAVDTQNTLVAGVKSQVLPSTEMYSEYRIEGDISGEDVVAVNGGKATLNLDENLVITPSIEFINYLDGVDKSDAIAASVGIRDTREKDAKKLLRLETRQSDDEKFYGVNGTYVQKLSDTTTVMVQDELRYSQYDDERTDNVQNTLTLAAAHRPQGDGKYNALYAYKWDVNDTNNENTHILSTHQHYRVNDELDVSGRLGGKKQTLQQGDTDHATSAVLADARALWDVTEKASLDVHGGLLATDGASEKRYAFGAGFTYNVLNNVRLGAGYNFAGFDDKDLDPEGSNTRGAYVGLQMKADEALFGWLTGEDEAGNGCQSRYMAERERQANEQTASMKHDNCNDTKNNEKAADHEQPVE